MNNKNFENASAKSSTGSNKKQKNQVALFNGKTEEEWTEELKKLCAEDARQVGKPACQEDQQSETGDSFRSGFEENNTEYQTFCAPWEVNSTFFALDGTKICTLQREFKDGSIAEDFYKAVEGYFITSFLPANIMVWQNGEETLLIIEGGTVISIELKRSEECK